MKPPSCPAARTQIFNLHRLSLLGVGAMLWLAASVVTVSAQTRLPGVAPAPTGAPQIGQLPVAPTNVPVSPLTPGGLASPVPQGVQTVQPYPGGLSLPPPGALPPQVPPVTATQGPVGTPPPAGTPVQPLPPSGGRPVYPTVIVPVVPVVPVVPGATLPPPGPGPFTALQILQSFQTADLNGDGELTRAEARFLPIVPMSFEQMDRNKDGVVTRSEYENAF